MVWSDTSHALARGYCGPLLSRLYQSSIVQLSPQYLRIGDGKPAGEVAAYGGRGKSVDLFAAGQERHRRLIARAFKRDDLKWPIRAKNDIQELGRVGRVGHERDFARLA